MTEQEAWELDELLTKTTPEVDPAVEGPFIKQVQYTGNKNAIEVMESMMSAESVQSARMKAEQEILAIKPNIV
ncbi:MAG: hypothetical protein LBK02_06095 [Treponema sp.]|jgi:hypothetical protein|nr:hypothetical protein [Treponema sp.]